MSMPPVGPSLMENYMNRSDWGFLHNILPDGNIRCTYGARLTQHHLLLTGHETEELEKMAREMDLPTHAVIKQGLRVLQMYRAGYLVDNSPKFGGCGVCDE